MTETIKQIESQTASMNRAGDRILSLRAELTAAQKKIERLQAVVDAAWAMVDEWEVSPAMNQALANLPTKEETQ